MRQDAAKQKEAGSVPVLTGKRRVEETEVGDEGGQEGGPESSRGDDEVVTNQGKKIRFRNYKPSDDGLAERPSAQGDAKMDSMDNAGESGGGNNGDVIASKDKNKEDHSRAPQPRSGTGIGFTGPTKPLTSTAKRQAAEAQATDIIQRELALLQNEELNVVPRNANWDIKAQVQGRLDKLKRRTKVAIVELLRQKIMDQQKEGDGDDDDEGDGVDDEN